VRLKIQREGIKGIEEHKGFLAVVMYNQDKKG
jgi:hypothetical protein